MKKIKLLIAIVFSILSFSLTTFAASPTDEDFHVANVGGERVVTVLAPDLKQKSSNSFSLSADWMQNIGEVQTNVTLEGFYTDLRDSGYIYGPSRPRTLHVGLSIHI